MHVDGRRRKSTYVDVRRRTSTYVVVRRRTSTYADVRGRTLTYIDEIFEVNFVVAGMQADKDKMAKEISIRSEEAAQSCFQLGSSKTKLAERKQRHVAVLLPALRMSHGRPSDVRRTSDGSQRFQKPSISKFKLP